jgi:enoyl-CoA hydratase
MDNFVKTIWSYPKPTIAAIHGYCLGGACELAMLCDLSIATESARIGEPEVRMGLGSTLVLPWLVSMKAAKELLLGGALVSGTRAYELGIVSEVVADDKLIQAAEKKAGLLAAMAPPALRLIKEGINHSYELRGFSHSIDYHTHLSLMMMLSPSQEKNEFLKIRAEQGVRAASDWRRNLFRDFDA